MYGLAETACDRYDSIIETFSEKEKIQDLDSALNLLKSDDVAMSITMQHMIMQPAKHLIEAYLPDHVFEDC
jgi:hypothetical protein